MSNAGEQLFQEMVASKVYLKEAVDNFKEKIDQLDNEATLKLIGQIIDRHKVYQYIQVIGYVIRNVTTDESFFSIIRKLAAGKTNQYLTHPWLVNDLVELGIQNPKLGLELYKKAKKMNDTNLLIACRWVFVGAGAKDYEFIHATVLNDIASEDATLRAASISAIRIAFVKDLGDNWKTQILSLLESKQEDPNQEVKRELVSTYITLYSYAKEPCILGILALCKKDPQLSYQSSNLLLHNDLSAEHYLKLILFFSESDDKQVVENILFSFRKWATLELIETELKIIYKTLERFSYFGFLALDEALKNLGKAEMDTCLKSVLTWSKDQNAQIRFLTPKIAVEFGRNSFDRLVYWLSTILNDPDKEWFVFETLRDLLEQIFERSSEGKNLAELDLRTVNDLLEKLKALAITRGLSAEVIAKREELSIYKCLALIETMENANMEIDFDSVKHNLAFFPNIGYFIGADWVKKMEEHPSKTHPLLMYLTDKVLDTKELDKKISLIEKLEGVPKKMEQLHLRDSIRKLAFLNHLEAELVAIKDFPSLRGMRAAIRQEEHFWKGISEIDVLSRLSKNRNFSLQIAPPLKIMDGDIAKIKHPDFGLIFEKSELYIEVISPEMFAPLRYFHNASIPNRVRAKITGEIKEHFKGMKTTIPVIIIVDLANSELHYDSIQDYVDGELQFVLRVNTKTREPDGVFTQRGKPMAITDQETQIIIGIIGYTRVMGKDGRIHLKGRKFPSDPKSQKSNLLNLVAKALLG